MNAYIIGNRIKPLKPATLGIGQIIWLNGYGQNKNYHERKAIYKVNPDNGYGITYHTINLDTFRTQRHDAHIKPDSEIFGIGMYYTPGDMATPEEIEAALAKAPEVEAEDKRKADEAAAAAETLKNETIKKWSGKLERVKKGDYSSWQLAARNIRRELKEHFPGQKFSVRGESFSMGDSITVRWTDGPTVKEVEFITNKYQEGHFNGMEDIYEYGSDPFNSFFGGTKYLHNEREYSESFKIDFRDQIPNDCKFDYEKERALYRILTSVSRYTKPEPAPAITAPVKDVAVSLNNEKNGIEIRFPGKPNPDVLTNLKKHGFRWHRKLKFWYAKQTENRLTFADSLTA